MIEQLGSSQEEPLRRGFLFACTDDSERECLGRLLFAAEKSYGPVVIRVRRGDILFLDNIDTDVLHGPFRAVSDGSVDIQESAFGGKYRYQVKVESLGRVARVAGAKRVLRMFGLERNKPIFRDKLVGLLGILQSEWQKGGLVSQQELSPFADALADEIEAIRHSTAEVDIEEEIPMIEATTFWDFPKQSYGLTPKGDNRYAGVTPALIIFNMIWRYTEPGELVVDPMAGSGTTIDVCRAEKRRAIGYDIHSTRPDIITNDAREIPLEDESVDMVFIDSPYGDNIRYNEEAQNIGNISSESEEFYDQLEKVMRESHRILSKGKVLGWLIGDQWVKKRFTPVGMKIYERLCRYFEPVDIVCVSRRNQSSNTGVWQNRARRFNFYLRGFKYLIIVRKTVGKRIPERPRSVRWARYARDGSATHEH
ncbi:MAG: DNA methylase [Dehalococcoidia bacterium]|nr:DNA methylase [Dehalococcoidia bacterium]